ncbi:acylphosphatase [Gimesia algae]|uniref:acylphosphatase n=1 Tax=Gimesia algae TaxID=2527971 RepID=A0A517VHC1_9PLAN|nr:acylphosphatase [Gimesia algae]QDT92409.1 Acylphosphatase [Gimesia algae]
MSAEPEQPDPSVCVALRAIYHGRVQGVGFRYQTTRLAQRYPITGYVKNLPDGTVELVAQTQDKAVLEQFFDDMMLTFATNVTDVSVKEIDSQPYFQQFQIER